MVVLRSTGKLLSSRSLLAVLTPARAVRTLPNRLPALIAGRLQRLGVAPQVIDAEIRAMTPVDQVRSFVKMPQVGFDSL